MRGHLRFESRFTYKKRHRPLAGAFLMDLFHCFDRISREGVHRLFRGVHFERLGALTNRNLDRTKYLFYNIDLFVLRPRILLNYRKEQGLMH